MARYGYEEERQASRTPVVIPGRIKVLVSLALCLLIIGALSGSLWENNKAGFCTVKQAAFSGELTVVSTPGVFWQGFGSVEPYKQAVTVSFGHGDGEGNERSGPISVQFNDAGTAKVYGNARFDIPIADESSMIDIHKQFRTEDHLVGTLLQPWVTEVCVLTASMFSTEDTYGGNKAEYIRLCQDQLQNGKYQTDVREDEQEDPLTKEKRRIKRVSIRLDKDGQPLRLENPLARYKIKAPQFLMTENFDYDKSVQQQIDAQRQAFMATNTARAEAQKASQDAITARAKGEASIAEAKAAQMVEKETATVKAQKEAEVAKISAEREATVAKISADKERAVAEIEKQRAEIEAKKQAAVAQIDAEQRLKVAELDRKAVETAAEGKLAAAKAEAEGRKAVLAADNALTARLTTYERVQAAWANALSGYRGNLVPGVVMGGGDGKSQPSVNDFIALLMAKNAADLGIQVSPTQAAQPGENNK